MAKQIPPAEVDADTYSSRSVGRIGNYYGGLKIIRFSTGKCFWGIEASDGTRWEEISPALFKQLNRHQDEIEAVQNTT